MRNLSFFIFLFCAHVHGEENFPKLDCQILQASGDFATFVQPEPGHRIKIDLNNIQDLFSGGSIQFQEGSYISVFSLGQPTLKIIPHGSHNPGGWEISASHAQDGEIKIDILHDPQSTKFNAWIINRQGLVGIAGLVCDATKSSQ
jgi:hypothetical protein